MQLKKLTKHPAWALIGQISVFIGLLLGIATIVDRLSNAAPRLTADVYPTTYVISPTGREWLDEAIRARQDTLHDLAHHQPAGTDTAVGSAPMSTSEGELIAVRPEQILAMTPMMLNIRVVNHGSKRATGIKILVRPSIYDAVVGRRLNERAEIRGRPVTISQMGKEFHLIPVGTLEPSEEVEVYAWSQHGFPNYLELGDVVVSYDGGVGVVSVARLQQSWRSLLWTYARYRPGQLYFGAILALVTVIAVVRFATKYRVQVSKRHGVVRSGEVATNESERGA